MAVTKFTNVSSLLSEQSPWTVSDWSFTIQLQQMVLICSIVLSAGTLHPQSIHIAHHVQFAGYIQLSTQILRPRVEICTAQFLPGDLRPNCFATERNTESQASPGYPFQVPATVSTCLVQQDSPGLLLSLDLKIC